MRDKKQAEDLAEIGVRQQDSSFAYFTDFAEIAILTI